MSECGEVLTRVISDASSHPVHSMEKPHGALYKALRGVFCILPRPVVTDALSWRPGISTGKPL